MQMPKYKYLNHLKLMDYFKENNVEVKKDALRKMHDQLEYMLYHTILNCYGDKKIGKSGKRTVQTRHVISFNNDKN